MRHRRPRPTPRHRARPAEERSLIAFVGSFPRADAPLTPALPEIAFLGRSNVGKSSLINAFVGQRIAKTSGTPGKTRMMNVFATDTFYLLDLPGYGYARAAKTELAAFRLLLGGVLARARLAGVVWLLDVRRDPSPEDRAMQDSFAQAGTRVLATLTKADKLSPRERRARAELLRETLGVPVDQLVLTSVKSGEGLLELREAVAGLIL